MTTHDAWVIVPDSTNAATSWEGFSWREGEVIAVLPGSYTDAQADAALKAVVQSTIAFDDKSDQLGFATADSYIMDAELYWNRFGPQSPGLIAKRVKNVRVESGRIVFDQD